MYNFVVYDKVSHLIGNLFHYCRSLQTIISFISKSSTIKCLGVYKNKQLNFFLYRARLLCVYGLYIYDQCLICLMGMKNKIKVNVIFFFCMKKVLNPRNMHQSFKYQLYLCLVLFIFSVSSECPSHFTRRAKVC